MNVLKRIRFSILLSRAHSLRFSLIRLGLIWFSSISFMSGRCSRERLPLFPILHHFNYVLLSTASFSVIFIAAFYSLPRSFSWSSGKNCLRFLLDITGHFFSSFTQMATFFPLFFISFAFVQLEHHFSRFHFAFAQFFFVELLNVEKVMLMMNTIVPTRINSAVHLLLVAHSLPLNLASVWHTLRTLSTLRRIADSVLELSQHSYTVLFFCCIATNPDAEFVRTH